MYLFKSQFFKNSRSSRDVTALRHICTFIILFYVEIWFTAPRAIRAPQHDLLLMQKLIQFREVNAAASDAALSKVKRHLWYLTGELAALALFDPSVSVEIKLKMVTAIKQRESSNVDVTRIELSEEQHQSLPEMDLSDFVTKKSMNLFEMCELPHGFLNENPIDWRDDQSFIECSEVFRDLKVVNDVAERGVALVEQFTSLITKDEEQYQYLLQVVKDHRKKYPNCNKKNFTDPAPVEDVFLEDLHKEEN